MDVNFYMQMRISVGPVSFEALKVGNFFRGDEDGNVILLLLRGDAYLSILLK